MIDPLSIFQNSYRPSSQRAIWTALLEHNLDMREHHLMSISNHLLQILLRLHNRCVIRHGQCFNIWNSLISMLVQIGVNRSIQRRQPGNRKGGIDHNIRDGR